MVYKTNNALSLRRPHLSAGFGLIELMVSIGIMVLVMSVIMVRQNAFDGASVLRNQAYEVALNIREMQLLAVSAINDGGDYRKTYGVMFDLDLPNNYTIWQDENGNNYYDEGTDSEFGKQGSIDPRFEILSITRIDTAAEIDDINISFMRPNFDAYLRRDGGAPVSDGVEIVLALKGDNSVYYTIEVTQTGQINVSQ